MVQISSDEFITLSKKHRYIPIYTEILDDIYTPVQVYQKIRNISPYSYLLESVQQDDILGRYSFIGYDPLMIFSSEADNISFTDESYIIEK